MDPKGSMGDSNSPSQAGAPGATFPVTGDQIFGSPPGSSQQLPTTVNTGGGPPDSNQDFPPAQGLDAPDSAIPPGDDSMKDVGSNGGDPYDMATQEQ